MPSPTMTSCEFRQAIAGNPRWSFCRHERVHVANHLVDATICSSCTQRTVPSRLRPIPDRVVAPQRSFVDASTEYISTERLISEARDFMGLLPADVGGVAGIPRSGMIPASALAAWLHVPLFEVGATGLRPVGQGRRLKQRTEDGRPLLVIDDSVFSGAAMRRARLSVQQSAPRTPLIFAALYPRPHVACEVDLYWRTVPAPHLFEWNLLNCNQTRHLALDFDGVLCQEWQGEPEDTVQYETFLRTARPRYLPRRRSVRLIVTARLERYRAQTEQWLKRHGVNVDCLVMGPWKEPASRHNVATFKARHYLLSKCRLFVESDPWLARAIWEIARQPVLCPTSGELLR